MKDLMIERMNQEADERFAQKLGLTYDELIEANYRIDTEESNDGLIYNYIISFDDNTPKEILAKIKGKDSNNTVWFAPWEMDDDDYYEEQYEVIISNKRYYKSFLQSLSVAGKLNKVDIDGEQLNLVFKRQIYISIIAAIEAFLFETFINLTDENDEFFRNFIETFPDFKERKIDFSRIFIEQERIRDTVKKVMIEIIYHNLAKVSNMYSSTFEIKFPDISELSRCVNVRHDLVHRNGKTKKGEDIIIDSDIINDLITKATSFVEDIAQKLNLNDN